MFWIDFIDQACCLRFFFFLLFSNSMVSPKKEIKKKIHTYIFVYIHQYIYIVTDLQYLFFIANFLSIHIFHVFTVSENQNS